MTRIGSTGLLNPKLLAYVSCREHIGPLALATDSAMPGNRTVHDPLARTHRAAPSSC